MASQRRFRGWGLAAGGLAVAGMLLAGVLPAVLAWPLTVRDCRGGAYAVVLGHESVDGRLSRQARSRLDAAVAWHEAHPERPLVVTGGRTGSRVPEAVLMARHLRDAGVPDERVRVEPEAAHTHDNLRLATELSGLPEGRPAVVTSPYHTLRARLVCADLGASCATCVAEEPAVHAGDGWGAQLAAAGWILREYAALAWFGLRYGWPRVVAVLVALVAAAVALGVRSIRRRRRGARRTGRS